MKRLILTLLVLVTCCCSYATEQTDSIGIYAVYGDVIEKIQPKKYESTHISAGMFRATAKLSFRGRTSPHHFYGMAVLRFYFREPTAYEAAKYHAFTPAASPSDFLVVEMKPKKDTRRMSTVSYSIFSMRAGAKGDKDVVVETKELRPGVYEMTVEGPAGEYCIAAAENATAGYSGIFDFTIDDGLSD